jgi:endonuclease YncB( thermonuclease family)
MRAPVLAFAIAGLVAMSGAIWLAGQQDREAGEASIAVEPVEMPPVPDEEPADAEPQATGSRAVRPEMIAPPQVGPGQLVRVEPRQPLSPLGRAGRHGPEGPRPTSLFQPLATAAGIVQSKGYTVQLKGIDIVAADETCTYRGAEWNCGVVARTAFRNFLRGRALACVLPEEEGKSFTLACTLGKEDPALWLARYGWAKAGSDKTYAEAVAEARRQGIGIFGPPPDGG